MERLLAKGYVVINDQLRLEIVSNPKRLSPTTFGNTKAAMVLADLINQELDQDYRRGRATSRAIGRVYADLTRRVQYLLRSSPCPIQKFFLKRALDWALESAADLFDTGRITTAQHTYLKNVLVTYLREVGRKLGGNYS